MTKVGVNFVRRRDPRPRLDACMRLGEPITIAYRRGDADGAVIDIRIAGPAEG